jgi:hypothetical protein
MPNLTINLGSLTGKTVPAALYGFSTGALADNGFANAAATATKNALTTIKPTLVRVNANQQIPEKYGTGNTGYTNNWWNNRAAFMDPNHTFVMSAGPSSDTGLPYSASQEATYASNFATAMRNAGHEITTWEIGNESLNILPDVASYLNYYLPIARALHTVNANYKVGGPATTWWGAYDPAQFANGVAAGDCDFYEFHAYNFQGITDHASIYNGAKNFGDADSIRTALRNTKLANVPIFLSEWNLDGDFNTNPGIQITYVGAIADALLSTRMWQGDPNIMGAAYWDAISDPKFGAIETNGQINPPGYYLGYAGQHMPGAEVTVSGVSGNLQVLATKNGSNVAIQLVNYDTASASANNITLTGGQPSGAITRWEIGKSNQSTPNVSTQASLSSVNVPSEQIVILTFSTAAAQRSLTVNAITGAQVGSTFTVSGTLTNFTSAPTLLYSDDGGGTQALPAGANVTATSYSFTHPAPTIAGNHTIVVTDGTNSASATYSVVDITWQSRPLTGSLSDTVTGLAPSTSYDFRVSAQNSLGSGPFSTVVTRSTGTVAPTLPGAPVSVSSSAVSSSSVTVTWGAPTTGSAPFTYRVQSSPAGLGTWTNRGTGVSGTSLPVTGLAATTSYDFRVFATNSVGEGPASSTYNVSTTTAAAAVTWDPANIGGGATLSNSNLTVTANGSTTPGTAFQGVRSTVSQSAGKLAFEVTTNALTQDMEIALVNGNHAQTTDAGEDQLNGIAFYPSGGGGSQAPMSVYQNSVQVLVPSGSPISDSPGSIVTFCVDLTARLFWVTSNAMRSVYGASAWNDSASANPATGVGGIPINITGALFICFFSSEGGAVVTLNAGSSTFSTFVPSSFAAWGGTGAITAPGAVTSLSGSPSSTSVQMTWRAPTIGTTPFTYHMQMSPTGTNTWSDQGTSSSVSGTVAGLTPGTGYDFRVYAANAAGNGGFSNTITVSTTSGVSGTTFDEEFGTLSLLNTRNTAAGGTWQPAVWYTDANGSPDGYGIDDGWFVNPFNPATPINDIYTIVSGSLNLAIEAKPASVAPSAVGNKPYMTGQLQTQPTFRQAGGYFEARLACPKLDGTMFAWWFYSDNGNQMNLEIPTVQGGGQFAKYSLWNQGSQAIVNEFYSYNMASPIDCTQFHTYGIDWNPPTGLMTFYIDGAQVMQAPIPAGFTDPMYMLLSSYTGSAGWYGSITNPAGLPIKMQVDYVRAFPIGHGPGSGVAAQPVTTFLSSLGVNVHIDQGFSANSYITPLQFTGIKNIRTGYSNIGGAVTAHNSAGVMVNVFGSSDLTSHLAAARTLATNGALLSIEGPNEPNNFPFSYLGNQGGGSGTWVPVAQYQRDLYAGVKADSQLQNFPVFHVSEGAGETDNVGMQFLTIPNGAGIAMPDGTKYADYANPHNYVSGNLGGQYVNNTAWNAADPTLNGSWDGLYVEYGRTWRGGFAGYSNADLQTLPRVTSETGWDSTSLGETIQGKVLLNTYLAQFKRGWRYTFIYEMFDQEASSGNQGLYRSDKVTAKLAATYIHNMTTILAGGSNIATTPLAYSIANQPATVHDLLLQKTGNVYDLIVWGEQVSGSNNVVVNLAVARSSIKVFDPTVGTAAVQTLTNASSVTLSVSDHPFIIEITL